MPMEIQTPEGRVKAMTPVILSASRSTDIPAYYGQWFMNRLRAGWCAWVNPFNRRPSYVSFRDVKAVVFWTKNPAPFLQHLDELDVRGLHYYFQYTLNDYEREGFEPNVPALEKRIETFRRLSERIGPDRVVWRFDPIILSPGTGPRDILMRIWTIGKALRGLTKKLVVSFVDVGAYRKVQANLVRDTGLYTRETVLSAEPDEAQRREICEGLAKIRERWHSEGWDIEISSCAEEADLAAWGITYNRCIDGELMERVFGEDKALVHFLHSGKLPEAPAAGADSLFGDPVIPVVPVSKRRNLKDKGQREVCGCIVSKDIGMYDTCMHFCAYCYATGRPCSRTAGGTIPRARSSQASPGRRMKMQRRKTRKTEAAGEALQGHQDDCARREVCDARRHHGRQQHAPGRRERRGCGGQGGEEDRQRRLGQT